VSLCMRSRGAGLEVQSLIQHIAAEQEFCPGKHAVLDGMTVTLPHADAAAPPRSRRHGGARPSSRA
jgi:hypothetical protein